MATDDPFMCSRCGQPLPAAATGLCLACAPPVPPEKGLRFPLPLNDAPVFTAAPPASSTSGGVTTTLPDRGRPAGERTPLPEACPRCGLRRQPDAPAGLCPKCLLIDASRADDEPERPEAQAGTRFGEYELIERIARGGMGIVYRARKLPREGQPHDGRVVALKMILGGGDADEEELQRFRAEIEAAAKLDHPNIVPIYEVGEEDGCPYFTMKLMRGRSLDDRLDELRTDRSRVCELLADVARAVHHGHQRAIIHRDLKPANILLDEHDVPHVADFGTAKHLANSRGLTLSGTVVGTPGYMAPEQARGEVTVTTAVDVHALGAILYELLTGRPPFCAETVEQMLHLVLTEEPVRPRVLDRTIDADLQTICLKCLEKEPARRYHSAEAVADDLEHFLNGEPVTPAVGLAGRAWRWARRHPAVAGITVALLSLFAVATLTAASVAQKQEDELRAEVLAADRYAARMASGTVLFQLHEYGDRVQRAAADPTLRALLEEGDAGALADAGFPEGVETPGPLQFDSWLLLDTTGTEVQRWPSPPIGYELRRDFSFRDYSRGALMLGAAGSREVYVARAFKSEADEHMKFAFSTPMYGRDGGMTGVMVGMVAANSELGPAVLTDPVDRGTATGVIISRRDRSRGEANAPPPTDFVYVVHDGLELGRQIGFDAGDKRGLQTLAGSSCVTERQGLPDPDCVVSDDDFRDEVPGFEGRWLAGLAPVGTTPLMIVVQTRDTAAQQPGQALAGRLLVRLPLILGCALLGGVCFFVLRRRR